MKSGTKYFMLTQITTIYSNWSMKTGKSFIVGSQPSSLSDYLLWSSSYLTLNYQQNRLLGEGTLTFSWDSKEVNGRVHYGHILINFTVGLFAAIFQMKTLNQKFIHIPWVNFCKKCINKLKQKILQQWIKDEWITSQKQRILSKKSFFISTSLYTSACLASISQSYGYFLKFLHWPSLGLFLACL